MLAKYASAASERDGDGEDERDRAREDGVGGSRKGEHVADLEAEVWAEARWRGELYGQYISFAR